MTPPGDRAVTVGWREWVELPDWHLRMRAKMDTGARSSAVDCAEIVELPDDLVRFTIRLNRSGTRQATIVAAIEKRTIVRSSTGHARQRRFVRTRMRIGGLEKQVSVNLVCRREMIHRMLVGREALAGDFVVDPARQHATGGRPHSRR